MQLEKGFPPIVCICGSTRFATLMHEAAAQMTLAGAIVVMPHFFGREPGDDKPEDYPVVGDAEKAELDALHFRKIALADAVCVVNAGGYVGESTAREVAEGERLKKAIHWVEFHRTVEQGFLHDGPPVEGQFPVLCPASQARLKEARDASRLRSREEPA